MSNASDWIDTDTLCQRLQIHRTTLWRVKERGLLKPRTHWVRKNPTSKSGPLLWNEPKVLSALRR